ncbi:Gfo/Idh/MocA family oxidoreductase [Bacteriovorax sp. Seq25_V]|uniref:Gfo/Idh/MocA family oxidoreductase n=1 Tax=Bacteriovorax sp. Seq25_V TaxID=1201288 RepID=UPI000389F596|nr:Gfo/Idh/MocA family oxidoreductase [Bacteriovorax sp. Seq25_V]EQC43546.1 oxidoreductase, NAD-binding domain protein [Bacteriovorax sp. Seq25_V]
MKNFIAVGVGGYIAPRHLEAINHVGGKIIAAYDNKDSVGILDRFTQDVPFFTTFEEYSYFLDKISSSSSIDYCSVMSPNYMHKFHIWHGLKNGADVICEKPLVLDVNEIDELVSLEQKFGKKINTVLQLRVHETIKELRKKILQDNKQEKYEVDLTYITSRGPWYMSSWKGNTYQSGGLPLNIGIHFFDMLTWLFGKLEKQEVHHFDESSCAGFLELEKAKVKWFLSLDKNMLPESAKQQNKTTYRNITFNGEEIEFSDGFTELHKTVYTDVLNGHGYGVEDARNAITIVDSMRKMSLISASENKHPFLRK